MDGLEAASIDILRAALRGTALEGVPKGNILGSKLVFVIKVRPEMPFHAGGKETGTCGIVNIVIMSGDPALSAVRFYLDLPECSAGRIRYLGWDREHLWHFRIETEKTNDEDGFSPCSFDLAWDTFKRPNTGPA